MPNMHENATPSKTQEQISWPGSLRLKLVKPRLATEEMDWQIPKRATEHIDFARTFKKQVV